MDGKTIKFIKKAQTKHDFKYFYLKSCFISSEEKVIITCPTHGDFLQTPHSHIRGYGCSKCANCHVLSNKEFINKSIEKHGDKYDYTLVEYKNNSTKVKIICKTHGVFIQSPQKHMAGHNCPKCSHRYKMSTEEFINRANLIHKNKYLYDESVFNKHMDKIIITCRIHGNFSQTANSHLNGSGCIRCSGKKQLTNDEFILKSNIIHNNKYDYSLCNYICAKSKVKIICNNHKNKFVFNQSAASHLSGSGCPKCSRNISKLETVWLDSLNIKLENRQISLPNLPKKMKVDGFDPKTNTVIQIHGDYFHANPDFKSYVENELHPIMKFKNGPNKGQRMTWKEVYEESCRKDQLIRDAGYNLIIKWENEFLK